jgi:hypothetical protein
VENFESALFSSVKIIWMRVNFHAWSWFIVVADERWAVNPPILFREIDIVKEGVVAEGNDSYIFCESGKKILYTH